jgi:hypothetical protein
MLIKPEVQLSLNPGPPRRRLRSISGCKCLLITAGIVLLPGLLLFFAGFVTKVIANVSHPHRALYQNTSLDEVSNRASVVQPLINGDQAFDIAATVWLRSTGSIGHEIVARRLTTDGQTDVHETPLYSDIIFRDLRLKRKTVFTTVDFTLPTDIL